MDIVGFHNVNVLYLEQQYHAILAVRTVILIVAVFLAVTALRSSVVFQYVTLFAQHLLDSMCVLTVMTSSHLTCLHHAIAMQQLRDVQVLQIITLLLRPPTQSFNVQWRCVLIMSAADGLCRTSDFVSLTVSHAVNFFRTVDFREHVIKLVLIAYGLISYQAKHLIGKSVVIPVIFHVNHIGINNI